MNTPPNEGDKVLFNLNGEILPAVVLTPWKGEVPIVAAKLGISEDEVIAMHGMRATVEVNNAGEVFTVKNAEHDPDGNRNGCWFYATLQELVSVEPYYSLTDHGVLVYPTGGVFTVDPTAFGPLVEVPNATFNELGDLIPAPADPVPSSDGSPSVNADATAVVQEPTPEVP